MKESISIAVDAVQKKRLMEEAHKRNLSLREFLRLVLITSQKTKCIQHEYK